MPSGVISSSFRSPSIPSTIRRTCSRPIADAFEASAPGWQFLTGKPNDIKAINAKFGDRSAERGLSEHRNEILIGNDATGDWQRDSAFGDVDQLVMTIRTMDPKWLGPVGATQNPPGGRFGLLCAQRSAGPGAVQKDVRSLPHDRRRRPCRAGPPRGRRSPRPRLAHRLHHEPGKGAGPQGPRCARARRKISGRAHASHGAWRNRRRGSHMPTCANKRRT